MWVIFIQICLRLILLTKINVELIALTAQRDQQWLRSCYSQLSHCNRLPKIKPWGDLMPASRMGSSSEPDFWYAGGYRIYMYTCSFSYFKWASKLNIQPVTRCVDGQQHLNVSTLMTAQSNGTFCTFSQLMCVETKVFSFPSSPLPNCPSHSAPIRKVLQGLQTVSVNCHSFWDLLPWHSPFHCPVPSWVLQDLNSPTCAVVLLHPWRILLGMHRSPLAKEETKGDRAPRDPPPHCGSSSSRVWGRGKKGVLERIKSIQSSAALRGAVLIMSTLIMLASLQGNLHWEQWNYLLNTDRIMQFYISSHEEI